MKLKRAQKIREVWDRIEDGDPDISTEMLFAMTCGELGSVMPCGDRIAVRFYLSKESSTQGGLALFSDDLVEIKP